MDARNGNGKPASQELAEVVAMVRQIQTELAITRNAWATHASSVEALLELFNQRLEVVEGGSNATPLPKKDFYDTEEAATILGLRPFTVRKHCREGNYEAHKIPNRRHGEWLISHDEIERIVNRRHPK